MTTRARPLHRHGGGQPQGTRRADPPERCGTVSSRGPSWRATTPAGHGEGPRHIDRVPCHSAGPPQTPEHPGTRLFCSCAEFRAVCTAPRAAGGSARQAPASDGPIGAGSDHRVSALHQPGRQWLGCRDGSGASWLPCSVGCWRPTRDGRTARRETRRTAVRCPTWRSAVGGLPLAALRRGGDRRRTSIADTARRVMPWPSSARPTGVVFHRSESRRIR